MNDSAGAPPRHDLPDPVAGYVQVPCIERRAWTAYCIASDEVPEQRRVHLDTCIAAMALTAKENSKYKETRREAWRFLWCFAERVGIS